MAFDDQQVDPKLREPAFQEQQSALQQGIGALTQEQNIAGKTGDIWSQIQRANEAQNQQGLAALRRQAAQTLYANRGSLGGGGGLAALQQGAASAGQTQMNAVAQANAQRAALAQEGQQAQLGAQGQIAEAAAQKYRIFQDQQNRQNRINQALSAAEDAAKHAIGGFGLFVTQADREKQAKAIRQQVLATETDPEVINAVNQFINNLGSYNNPSAIGVGG